MRSQTRIRTHQCGKIASLVITEIPKPRIQSTRMRVRCPLRYSIRTQEPVPYLVVEIAKKKNQLCKRTPTLLDGDYVVGQNISLTGIQAPIVLAVKL